MVVRVDFSSPLSDDVIQEIQNRFFNLGFGIHYQRFVNGKILYLDFSHLDPSVNIPDLSDLELLARKL